MFQHSHLSHTKVFCNLKYFNSLQEVSNLLQQEEVRCFCWLGGYKGGLNLDLCLKMLLSSTPIQFGILKMSWSNKGFPTIL